MNDVVSETLKKWRQTSFGYDNGNDCLLSLADYLIDCGYPDFGKKFRNTFTDEKGAYSHIKQYGGEEFIIDETGLKRCEIPNRGDIVLIKLKRNVAGLFLGNEIAFRTNRGVIEISSKFVEISHCWSVEKCQP